MQKVTLGKEGPKVARLGVSCVPALGSEAEALLREAWDSGLNLIDTRTFDATGKRALQGRRKDAVLLGGFEGSTHGPGQVAAACDAALLRLGLDCFDVFAQRAPHADAPIEDSMGALARLVEAGKVRHVALCDISCATLRRAHAVHPLAAVQGEYALWHRDAEVELLATLRGLNIALLAQRPRGHSWAPGGAAASTDAADDRGQGAMAQRVGLVDILRQVAQHSKASPAQVALAWLLAQGNDVVPLVDVGSVADVQRHAQALQLRLTPTLLDKLDLTFHVGVARPGKVSGQA